MLYKIFESSIKRLIFPQTAVKSGIPTESLSKNRKFLIVKNFRFSLLDFWRVFGEIIMSDSAPPPKISINQNMDYPPHEIFLRSHTSLIPKLEFQPA